MGTAEDGQEELVEVQQIAALTVETIFPEFFQLPLVFGSTPECAFCKFVKIMCVAVCPIAHAEEYKLKRQGC